MSKHLFINRGHPASQSHRPNGSTGQSLYESVTAKIIEALERGVIPWRKPWQGSSSLPCNALSKRAYHGINLLLLGLAPYRDHRWLTFRQAGEIGGHVKPGERSSIAIFWKRWDIDQVDRLTGQTKRETIPLLRQYHLFNVEQCVGLDLPPLELADRFEPHERIQQAEALAQSMLNPPGIAEGGNSAYYRPADDLVQVPPIGAFLTPDAYYATLFHELGHATGHETRLNRPGVTATIQFGSGDYSREELIAELTSAFCCAALGLDNSLNEDAASYIQGWLKRLRGDPKVVIAASTQGQRAADYIRGLSGHGAVDVGQEVHT